MKRYNHVITGSVCLLLMIASGSRAQTSFVDSLEYYNQVKTYVNPVLPGDHPDPTLLKVGDDFYHCGSSFHFTPYLPVYHSKDLVHWEVISRIIYPSAAAMVSDKPSGGIWQGAITYFYGSYWIYFSSNGQWFCKASSPAGPWSAPVQVRTNRTTGPLGYDNSIFVDDDGKPYMLIKNGQKTNRIQAIGQDGQLTDTVINLDWINANLQYSWAEGPVMCKRNGYYFYFPAGDVSGGQYVLRGSALTADSTKWERLGNFFKDASDPRAGFKNPNHISAPIRLADGTWWTIGQSYERHGSDDWSGMGRQTSLYPVIWEGNRPWGMAPVSTPVQKPGLPKSGILWRSVHADYFDHDSLNVWWHFLDRKSANQYSLSARKGWVRLSPGTARTHLMQKETDHYYTVVTRVDMDAKDTSAKAGIYLTNGNQTVYMRLYSGYDHGKKILFRFDTATRSIPNQYGNTVWLKLERKEHSISTWCSGDGNTWTSVGAPISSVSLDKAQPGFNSWVGTSVGLFAECKTADFDLFVCKDGFSTLAAAGYSNYYGVQTLKQGTEKIVTSSSDKGGWCMLSGVELGNDAAGVEVMAASTTTGNLEIWLDDMTTGKLIATVPVTNTGAADSWKLFHVKTGKMAGRHDVFIKFPEGKPRSLFIKSIRFDNSIPSLKETFKGDFLIGTALNTDQIEEKDPMAAKLVPQQFNAATPENIMKAGLIHPGWDKYEFTLADKLVEYGHKHNIKINAHALIWHSQLPGFVRQIKSADSLRQFFTNHINTVAGRYNGKVASWDVVNEALDENGSLRKSIFLQQLGEDYIVEAFRLAQKAAPNTELYYNDYNIEQPKKRAGAIAIIKKIQAAGVRIDGVGIQGHWRASKIPLQEIEKSIQEFAALGVQVMFTELDLSVLPNPWDADNADVSRRADNNGPRMNLYPNGLPDSVQAVLSKGYEDLFKLFLKHKDTISRITFWGVNDGQSWLNNFPIRGRTNYPLLFDRQFAPKPAFYKVIATKDQ